MITLFGATGFTGRLIAANLAQKSIPFRLAGRSEEKLSRLSASLPGKPPWISADVTRPATLTSLFQNSQVLINCAGPFTDLGERVLSQAALSGCSYIDVTNELGYLYKVRGYHEMARRTGAALVPACGFEVALADCAASVLASKANLPIQDQPVDEVNVIYDLGGKESSSGTRRSIIRSLATSWIAYRDGQWTGAIPGSHARRFGLPNGNKFALSIPSCESITIPAHLDTLQVDVWAAVSRAQFFWGPILVPLFARACRSILREPILQLAGRGNVTPASSTSPGLPEETSFSIFVSLRNGKDIHWMTISAWNPYHLTANIAAYAAVQLINSPEQRKGLLSPAQAFDPQEFLNTASQQWKVILAEGKSKY